MHLRRLVVRGFKSFADRTVLDFAPGISVIVGPNGSGKSNIVDAIAWVLGEHSAKSLRGGKMEDVIFAGTPHRPAHGRAEVELTIDNTDGALPIEFTEVTLRRTLFRSGESEYAINGTACRLLDVQELLSDSGIGREMHTLVGQGHLDDILSGSPADRRAAIEEAAGLLKYRKRKEKSLRKLERVEADLERLGDILGELKRQIRPLERQAEVAKRAAGLQEELQEARLRAWVIDYNAVLGEDDAVAAATAVRSVAELSATAATLIARVEALEADAAIAQRDTETQLSLELRLAGARDRFQALSTLATERGERLADRAARAPVDDAPSPEDIAEARESLTSATTIRADADAEQDRLEQERSIAQAARDRAAAARERVMQLRGELAGLASSLERARAEREELQAGFALGDAATHVAREAIEVEREALEGLESREKALAVRSAELDGRLNVERTALAEALDAVGTAERALAKFQARRSMLDEELVRYPDTWSVLDGTVGIVGRVTDQIRVPADAMAAVRAALGPWADAVLADSREDAVRALDALRAAGARATMVLPGTGATLPAGVRSVAELVTGTGKAAETVRGILGGIAFAETLAAATAVLDDHRGVVVVTRDGARLSTDAVTGGAIEQIRDLRLELRTTDEAIEGAALVLASTQEAATNVRSRVEIIEAESGTLDEELNDLDAESAGAQTRLEASLREIAGIEHERATTTRRIEDLDGRIATDEARRTEVEVALANAVTDEPPVAPEVLAGIERDLARRALALGEATERERAATALVKSLEERAAKAVTEHERFELGRAGWLRGATRCKDVAAAATAVFARVEIWLADARTARAGGDARRSQLEQLLQAARLERRTVEAALEQARQLAHEADLRRSDRVHRLEVLESACRERLGLEPAEAVEAVSPDPIERDGLGQQIATLERRLSLLGKINPIAMEQFDELVERHRFLNEQSEDLRRSKQDLLEVVNEIDGKIVEIFSQAFTDVAREFEDVFPRLFPGGEGRITLTNPENLLETGIDVEARPAGKKVKRVSLLSGGERSLVALGLLFAIFRSRPSPFYLLDEVEAALDDVNLHRLLGVIRDFKETAQLLIVTHQKRTMAIGDTIYGISMAGDGVTQVLSEKLDRLPEVV